MPRGAVPELAKGASATRGRAALFQKRLVYAKNQLQKYFGNIFLKD
jgi:hypothetical protein